jgi:hypothetical protein
LFDRLPRRTQQPSLRSMPQVGVTRTHIFSHRNFWAAVSMQTGSRSGRNGSAIVLQVSWSVLPSTQLDSHRRLSVSIVISTLSGEAFWTTFTFVLRLVVRGSVNSSFVPSPLNFWQEIPAPGCTCGYSRQMWRAFASTNDLGAAWSARKIPAFRRLAERLSCACTGQPSRRSVERDGQSTSGVTLVDLVAVARTWPV